MIKVRLQVVSLLLMLAINTSEPTILMRGVQARFGIFCELRHLFSNIRFKVKWQGVSSILLVAICNTNSTMLVRGIVKEHLGFLVILVSYLLFRRIEVYNRYCKYLISFYDQIIRNWFEVRLLGVSLILLIAINSSETANLM